MQLIGIAFITPPKTLFRHMKQNMSPILYVLCPYDNRTQPSQKKYGF